MEINKIYKVDCIGNKGMCLIPDKTIDLIICDLPYGDTKNSWDCIIPFEKLWKQYNRIIKDNGAILLFGQGLFFAKLQLSNEKLYRYDLIWEKDRPSGFLNASRMPLRSHEKIAVFYKKLPIYNPIFSEGKPLHGMGKKYKEGHLANNNYGKFNSHLNPSANRKGDTKKYPRSVLHFPKSHPPVHPTEKPVSLMQYLVETFSDKGALVLDNCCGHGSTMIACVNTGRNYIGMDNGVCKSKNPELNDRYWADIVTERIEKTLNSKENIKSKEEKQKKEVKKIKKERERNKKLLTNKIQDVIINYKIKQRK